MHWKGDRVNTVAVEVGVIGSGTFLIGYVFNTFIRFSYSMEYVTVILIPVVPREFTLSSSLTSSSKWTHDWQKETIDELWDRRVVSFYLYPFLQFFTSFRVQKKRDAEAAQNNIMAIIFYKHGHSTCFFLRSILCG